MQYMDHFKDKKSYLKDVVSKDLEMIQRDVSYIKIQLQTLISNIKVMEENNKKKESIPTKEEVSKGWFFS